VGVQSKAAAAAAAAAVSVRQSLSAGMTCVASSPAITDLCCQVSQTTKHHKLAVMSRLLTPCCCCCRGLSCCPTGTGCCWPRAVRGSQRTGLRTALRKLWTTPNTSSSSSSSHHRQLTYLATAISCDGTVQPPWLAMAAAAAGHGLSGLTGHNSSWAGTVLLGLAS